MRYLYEFGKVFYKVIFVIVVRDVDYELGCFFLWVIVVVIFYFCSLCFKEVRIILDK